MSVEERSRAATALAQHLRSLQQAGVTHLPRARQAADAPEDASQEEIVPKAENSEKRQDVATDSPQEQQTALDALRRRVAKCTRCQELAATRTQTVFGVGNPAARLVFLGEAPGADEDAQGEPFVGRAGKLLTDIVTKGMGLTREDVYICNILRCRPPGNRNPLPIEADNCREYLDGQLAIIRPEFICCLGTVAAQNLLDTTESIGRLRGSFHDYQGIRVLCTYHPAYLLRNPPAKRQVWDDIQILMAAMGLEKP